MSLFSKGVTVDTVKDAVEIFKEQIEAKDYEAAGGTEQEVLRAIVRKISKECASGNWQAPLPENTTNLARAALPIVNTKYPRY